MNKHKELLQAYERIAGKIPPKVSDCDFPATPAVLWKFNDLSACEAYKRYKNAFAELVDKE